MAIIYFEVNISNLTKDKNDIQAKLSVTKTKMTKMFEEIRELDAMWDGSANRTFNEQFNADYNTLKKACETIDKLVKCIEYAAKEYGTCEKSVKSKVGSIRI